MRFLYLILAHRDLDQLRALIARLLRDDPQDRVLLHFDARSPVDDDALRSLAAEFAGAVELTTRTAIWWGHASQVVAELVLLEAAAARQFDYVHLLSGQDWPLRTKAEIVASISPGEQFVRFEADMSHRMNDHFFDTRLNAPTMTLTVPQYYRKRLLCIAARAYDRVLTRLGRARTCPVGPQWVKGSTWWSLDREAVAWLTPRLRALVDSGRLRFTVCSDEHAIQTLLHYAPFADRIRDYRRLIVWEGGNSPLTLTREHVPALRASDAWFARKFEAAKDPFFLEL